jgi:hypothetical protein
LQLSEGVWGSAVTAKELPHEKRLEKAKMIWIAIFAQAILIKVVCLRLRPAPF